jgi:large subunit ribosomal protein L10
MARSPKSTAVEEITEEFRSSSAAVLTEYRGLTVAQLKELRRSLGGNATYAVVKNTLTKIAAKDAGVEGLDSLLAGPSAIAFIKGDPVVAAKGLRDFAKAHPMLVIKGGYLDGKVLSAADVTTLADLESREVLLAKLAGAMNASLQQAVSLFAAPLSQAARAIDALRVAAQADPSLIGGAGTAPAADVAPEAVIPAPEAEAPAEATPEVAADAVTEVTETEAPAEVITEAEAPAEAEVPAEAPADAATDAAAAAEEIAEG